MSVGSLPFSPLLIYDYIHTPFSPELFLFPLDRMIPWKAIPSVADVLAIPFFLIAFLYVWRIPHKTFVEYVLLLFTGAGFVLDTLFTLSFFNVLS